MKKAQISALLLLVGIALLSSCCSAPKDTTVRRDVNATSTYSK